MIIKTNREWNAFMLTLKTFSESVFMNTQKLAKYL